ncbi:hypothetical protein B0H19DRAFT_1227915 [Mycena capillaripes]|nr:hypothetical protein B0H19DRAFT_1227915 [Mycena capillaripes]
MHNPPLQLIASLVFACVAVIPSNALRYTTLALAAALAIFCNIYLRSPSAQLCRLSHAIDHTDKLIGNAMLQCPRNHLGLVNQTEQLLQASRSTSLIKCRILGSKAERFSWNKYRLLCKDIAVCVTRVSEIRTAVQLILETEHQRKLADNITETQLILATASTQPTAFATPVIYKNVVSQYSTYR